MFHIEAAYSVFKKERHTIQMTSIHFTISQLRFRLAYHWSFALYDEFF